MDEHILIPGKYVICDPAFLIRKTEEGDQLSQQIIQLFYQDMNQFHLFTIDGVDFHMFRSEGGDGIFNGVGTDTGTFVIVNIGQLHNEKLFRSDFSQGKIIVFETDQAIVATFKPFDLYLSNGIHIHTE